MRTVFEKSSDVDLMAVVAIAETFNRNVVGSVTVTDKDAIQSIVTSRQKCILLYVFNLLFQCVYVIIIDKKNK